MRYGCKTCRKQKFLGRYQQPFREGQKRRYKLLREKRQKLLREILFLKT